MPHTLRSVDLEDETIAELEMIDGFDGDLAGEATRISNRLRGLMTQIHPHLERVLGPRVQRPGRPDAAGTVRGPGPDPQGRQATACDP